MDQVARLRARRARRRQRRRPGRGRQARPPPRVAAVPRPPLSVLLDHFDHIAKVAGVDHVGIGSDFDGIEVTPQQMEDVTMLPRIAQGLLDRGYSESDVKKILGGNMMRVMQIVLKPAPKAKPARSAGGRDAEAAARSGSRRRFASRASPRCHLPVAPTAATRPTVRS